MFASDPDRREAWRCAIAFAATLVASQLFAPALIGVAALAGSIACLFLPAAHRFDAAANILAWLIVFVVFGPSGAGCLILAQATVALAAAMMGRRLLPVSVVAAVACVYLPWVFPGVLWVEIVAILAIGAPGFALARQAGAGDTGLFEAVRCGAVAPQLVAIVGGAAIAGLPGAATAIAAGWLLAPVAALLLSRGRPGAAMASIGTLAASLCAAMALEALRPAAPAPMAILAGATAGFAALRLHAPVTARLLVRRARRHPMALRFPWPVVAR